MKEVLDTEEVNGLNIVNIMGYGNQKGIVKKYRGAEYRVNLLPKIKVETVVAKENADKLIDKIVNGAQPIDQFVFRDDDGSYYMYYGGWHHCNMVKLSDDLLSIVPFDDGTLYKSVTPENYVEGPFMLKRNGKYYFCLLYTSDAADE